MFVTRIRIKGDNIKKISLSRRKMVQVKETDLTDLLEILKKESEYWQFESEPFYYFVC